MVRRGVIVGIVLAAAALFSVTQAQDPGGRRGRVRATEEEGAPPAQNPMVARWLATIGEQFGGGDDWKRVEPKVEKILDIQRDMRTGMSSFRWRIESAEPLAEQSKVAAALSNLRAAVDDKNTPSDAISTRLKAFREEREKARLELQALQKELKTQLNPRQEAVLVVNGVLE